MDNDAETPSSGAKPARGDLAVVSAPAYSRAYERIVGENEDDVDHLLAYALFKRTINHRYKDGGKLPAEMRDLAQSEVDVYLSAAREMLDGYTSTVLDAAAEEMQKQAYTANFADLSKDIEDVVDSFEKTADKLTTAVGNINTQFSGAVTTATEQLKGHVTARTSFWSAVVTNFVAWLGTLGVAALVVISLKLPDILKFIHENW